MELSLQNKNAIKITDMTVVSLFFMLVCSLLTGIFSQNILTGIIVFFCIILFIQDELYLAYPFIIFFNELYGIAFGMSLSRIVSLLMIARYLYALSKNKVIKVRYLIPLSVYLFYSMFVISEYSLRRSIVSLLDVVCCILIVSRYIKDHPDKLKKFFQVYIMVAIVAFITGLLNENIYMHGEMSRFMATFEDPNYMGYFYTIGVFALVSLKLFKAWMRYILILFMYIVILASLSLTAIVVNVLLWVIYLAITKNISVKTFLAIVLAMIVVFAIYNYGLDNPNVEYIGNLSLRVKEAITRWTMGDLGGATTGRFDLMIQHIEYYMDQSAFVKLFGGIAVNTHYIHPDFTAAAHNEFVDMLLNVGIVGTGILLGFTFSNFFTSLKKYWAENDNIQCCIVTIKLVWMVYCCSLTVFMDGRFMIPFFI